MVRMEASCHGIDRGQERKEPATQGLAGAAGSVGDLCDMPKTEEDKIRDQLNQGVWDQSSDELRQFMMNRYVRGESDGDDIPDKLKRHLRRDGLFGKAVGIAIILGIGYLAFRFGGALSAFVRSIF